MAPIWGIRPHVGVDAVVPAFVVIVLGGVGSFWGAVIAGLLVGMAVGLTGAFATDWSLISMYLLLILVVAFRARGLLGKKSVLEELTDARSPARRRAAGSTPRDAGRPSSSSARCRSGSARSASTPISASRS